MISTERENGYYVTTLYELEQQALKQKDLVDVFRSRSIVSEVANGKRQLNNQHIRKSGARFGVSLEVLFWPLNLIVTTNWF